MYNSITVRYRDAEGSFRVTTLEDVPKVEAEGRAEYYLDLAG